MLLPRLLYLSDVPVESSYHGSALIFRLLQNYPAEKLMIIEGDLQLSLPERRLPEVKYRQLCFGMKRFLNTRFHKWVSSLYSAMARGRMRRIPPLLDGFKPEAVLTVAHGYSWMTAAAFADNRGIPLHLIIHDDWPRIVKLADALSNWLDRQFCRVYNQAMSRLCISPYMMEEYFRRYGVEGNILYPSREADSPTFSEPPHRLNSSLHEIVIAFAGTINTADHVRCIRAMAELLESYKSFFLIYGPLTEEQAIAANLDIPNIKLKGLLPSRDLLNRLRDEVDVLFVPMSFDIHDRSSMQTNFPSKLADYTAVGLPLLIYGPEYSSAVRWARENPGVAEVVDSRENGSLETAIKRLVSDHNLRMQLAHTAIEIGNRYFSHEAAWRIFSKALMKTRQLECYAEKII